MAISLALISAASAQDDTFIRKSDQPHPFGTPAEEQGIIAGICGAQLPRLGAAGCACLAERAMIALDDPQRNYLILSVVQPPAADRTATAKSPADLKTVALFLDKAGTECAESNDATPADVPAMPPPGTVTPGTSTAEPQR